MIRVWQDRKLAEELAQSKVTEKQKLTYLILANVSTILLTNGFSSEPNPMSTIDAISLSLSAIIATVGYVWGYRLNADNKNFIERCICLSVPISVKALTIFFAAVIIFSAGSYLILGEEKAALLGDSELLWLVLLNIFMASFMIRLNVCIKDIQIHLTHIQAPSES